MKRAWRFAAHDRQLVRELSRALGCAPLLAQILAARGVRNRQEADRFMSARLNDLHEPGTLPGVPEASERIVAAIRAGRRITIYGDYDVDGVTATAILYRCCQLAWAKVDY